jgi:hypothetical protein
MNKLFTFYDAYRFEIFVAGSVTLIIILYILNKNKKGTWSKSYFLLPKNDNYIPQQKPDSSGETECRRFLESFFRKPFGKTRPDILKNPVSGGNNLELDCFNQELKLAVEYNGIQHYKYVPHFHKNREAFINQKYRDYMKNELCIKNNISFI